MNNGNADVKIVIDLRKKNLSKETSNAIIEAVREIADSHGLEMLTSITRKTVTRGLR